MPYFHEGMRKYYRKKYYPKKRSVYRKVNYLTKQVKKLNYEKEIRYDDQNIGVSVSDAGVFYLLNGFTKGSSDAQREGTSLMLKSIQLSYTFLVADTYNEFRIMLVYDKQPNGTTVTSADLLTVPTNPIHSFKLFENRNRFKILYDRTLSSDTDDPVTPTINYYRKLNLHTTYNSGNAGTIADINTGALYLVAYSDSAAVSHPTINVNTRLRYV